MKNYLYFLFSLLLIAGCNIREQSSKEVKTRSDPNEIFGYYSEPEARMVYSHSVQDSFKLFTSLPSEYTKDSLATYPLILVLDANAYFESIVSEMKFATLTQGLPKSIVVGIGYKNFWAMDSLRNRDYTFPVAPPEDEFAISGGGDKFKKFIDEELLPSLSKEYRIDKNKITLLGHSLGGYFTLYHLLYSLKEKKQPITRYIAASPSLHYSNQHLLNIEKELAGTDKIVHFKLYLSMGSLEHSPDEKENLFLKFKAQMDRARYPKANIQFVELGNFDHMEAAMPGFMKGLVFASSESN